MLSQYVPGSANRVIELIARPVSLLVTLSQHNLIADLEGHRPTVAVGLLLLGLLGPEDAVLSVLNGFVDPAR